MALSIRASLAQSPLLPTPMMLEPNLEMHSSSPNIAVEVGLDDADVDRVDVIDVVADDVGLVVVVGVEVWVVVVVAVDVCVVEVSVVDGVLVTVVVVVGVVVLLDVALLVGLEVPLLVGVVMRHPSNAAERNASATALTVASVAAHSALM